MPAVTESHNEGSPMEPALEHTPAGRAVPPLGTAAIVVMATGFGWVGGGEDQMAHRTDRAGGGFA